MKYKYLIILLLTFLLNGFAEAQKNVASKDTLLSVKDTTLLSKNDTARLDTTRKRHNALTAPVDYQAKDSIIMTGNNWAYLYGEGDVKYQQIELQSERIEVNMDSSLVYAKFGVDSIGTEFGYPLFKEGEQQYESKTMIFRRLTGAVLFLSLISFNPGQAQEATPQASRLLSNSIDVSKDFSDFTHLFFFADSLSSFNTATGEGSVAWKRETLFTRQAFNTNTILPFPAKMLDFPETGYEANPRLQFSIDFVSNHTVRLRMATSNIVPKEGEEVMLVQNPTDKQSWKYIKIKGGHKYQSPTGETLVIEEYPWRILLYDSKGKLLTSTRRWMDNDSTQVKVLPFCFIRRGDDNSRSINPVFSLSPNEKIVGCGESFTSLNKVGQKVNLFVTDPQGPETADMYKPIPFFMSSRGYGMYWI